jgi:hypothetical protein
MWHAITPVTSEHDPVLCEGSEKENVLILNAGPAPVSARAWSTPDSIHKEPNFKVELRAGDQRVISGSLVRVKLLVSTKPFAAVAWQLLPK